MAKCPVCGEDGASEILIEESNNVVYICPNCGKFVLDKAFGGFNSSNRHLIAGYLYETQDDSFINHWFPRIHHLNGEDTAKILSSPLVPKTHMQRLDKLLLHFYKQGKAFSTQFEESDLIPQMGYARDEEELYNMLNAVVELGYFTRFDAVGGNLYTITIKGLERAEALLNEQKLSRKIFVAMKFNDEMREILKDAIKPACEECGYEGFAVDEKEYLGGIPDRIVTEIKTSRFVIADFTENNNGVYFEAGYANGKGIPVIQTCKKSWFDDNTTDSEGNKINQLHFDIRHNNTILWKDAEDLKRKLVDRIRALGT